MKGRCLFEGWEKVGGRCVDYINMFVLRCRFFEFLGEETKGEMIYDEG